jgi:hypothetical protein
MVQVSKNVLLTTRDRLPYIQKSKLAKNAAPFSRLINKQRVASLSFLGLLVLSLIFYASSFDSDITWYLELIHSVHDACGPPRWEKDPSLYGRLPSVFMSDYPVYIIHGRPSDLISPVVNPLKSHNISFRDFRPPTPSPERLAEFGQDPTTSDPVLVGTCKVTLAHRDVLKEAFEGDSDSPTSSIKKKGKQDSVIIMEDDAILQDYKELLTVLAYYEMENLPFLSLFRTDQRCTKYLWGTQAYVIRRSFYETLLYGDDKDSTKCLGTCTMPIDVCLSHTFRLQKTQATVFLHGNKLLPSLKRTKLIRRGNS